MQRNVFACRGRLVCKYWDSSHFFFYVLFLFSDILIYDIVFYGDRRTIYKIEIYRTKLCILNIRTTVDEEVSLGRR